MKVTDKNIPLDDALVKKLDEILDKRILKPRPKWDAFIIIDGEEGYGKTTYSLALAYYIHYKTGRPFSEKNLFFDPEDLIKFAKATEKQIIIWDEAAISGLSTEWFKKSQIDLGKLLMTCRKKRHFFIFNIPEFFELRRYFIRRALGLLHVYARHDTEIGRFVYYNKQSKNKLANLFLDRKKRTYKKFISIRGSFPDVLDERKPYNILDVFNEAVYDKQKDEAITNIGKEVKGLTKQAVAYYRLLYRVYLLKNYLKINHNIGIIEIEKNSFINNKEISRGGDIPQKYPEIFRESKYRPPTADKITN